MKKTLKRILAIILSAVMVLTAVPLSNFAGVDLFSTKAEAKEYAVGDIIEFGSYPQSKVTDSATLSALNAQIADYDWEKDWISYKYLWGNDDGYEMLPYDYMKYCDIKYNDELYRAVKFTRCRNILTYNPWYEDSYQPDNGYYENIVYWFKYESIDWRILNPNDGLIMCETIIDSQAYCNTIYGYKDELYNSSEHKNYANDYATSSIREWLNDDFYNTAFTTTQKSNIKTTTLDNSAYSSSYSKYDSATTKDKVFLLSYDEVLNTKYGFNSSYSNYDTARRAQGSDYAKCQGLSIDEGNSNWFLRSSGYPSNFVCRVHSYGGVDDCHVGITYCGIRPALQLDNILTTEETIDSSENDFIEEHIRFVNSSKYEYTLENRYAKFLWENYHSSLSQASGEFAYDVLEGTFEWITFQALDGGLSSTANPYDLIIIDILASYDTGEKIKNSIDLSDVSAVVKFINDDFVKIFNPAENWADGLNIDKELKELFTLKSEKKDYSSNALYKVLKNVIGNSSDSKTKINKVFSSCSYVSDIMGYIGDGFTAVEYFLELSQYVSAIEAYINSSEEFKDVLSGAAKLMYGGNTYKEKFNEALSVYNESFSTENIVNIVLEHALKDGLGTALGMCKDVFQKLTQKTIQKVFNLSAEVAGKYVAVFWAAEKGFELGNLITRNDVLVNSRRMLRANYWLEDAIYRLMETYKNNLTSDNSYKNALNFDAAFNVFKNMQLYSLDMHAKYMDASSKSALNGFLSAFQNFFGVDETLKKKYTSEVERFAIESAFYKSLNCHGTASSYTHNLDSVRVACPTNIYVYNSVGKLVASVVEEVVSCSDSNIYVYCIGEEKVVLVPDINDYTVKIEAYENGEMSVSCSQKNGDLYISYDVISLSKSDSFVFNVSDSESADISSLSYLLSSNNRKIYPACEHAHQFDEWTVTKEATETETGILTTVCSVCGETYTQTIPKLEQYSFTYTLNDNCITITGYSGTLPEKLIIPNQISGYLVTEIAKNAFRNCKNIEVVELGDNLKTIGDKAFCRCINLKNVKISKSVENLGVAVFMDCFKLENIVIDESNPYYKVVDWVIFNKDMTQLVDYITRKDRSSYIVPESVTTISLGAFSGDNVINVVLPQNLIHIEMGAFEGCHIEEITIPCNVETMGWGAFVACGELKEVTILSSKLKKIEGGAFGGCKKLEKVILQKSITTIDAQAFIECDSILDVFYGGTQSEWNKISIDVDNDALLNATVHFNYVSHICDYATFSHYQSAHPHYAVYKCSCGEEKVTTTTSKVEGCTECYPVVEKTLVSIAIKTPPTTYEYKYGIENLDTTGLEIVATYSDGTTAVIDNSEVEFTGFDTSTRGFKTITATYEGCTATFDIEVYYTFWQWLLYILCFGWIWM